MILKNYVDQGVGMCRK